MATRRPEALAEVETAAETAAAAGDAEEAISAESDDAEASAAAVAEAGAAEANAEKSATTGDATVEDAPVFRLYDMHCHLDRMADPIAVCRTGADLGVATFCCTVTPSDYAMATKIFADQGNVRVGAGLHPWWIDNGMRSEEDAARAAAAAARSRFVGEVGLDFGRTHGSSRAEQLAAFEWIVRACADRPLPPARPGRRSPRRLFSVHAVRSASAVLDILGRFDLLRTSCCIFHWFSGTSDELARARRLGCYFSVNEMMLATRRGREYARQIPEDQLLLETDAPPTLGGPYTAAEQAESLERTLTQLARIRACDRDQLAMRIAETSSELLGL